METSSSCHPSDVVTARTGYDTTSTGHVANATLVILSSSYVILSRVMLSESLSLMLLFCFIAVSAHHPESCSHCSIVLTCDLLSAFNGTLHRVITQYHAITDNRLIFYVMLSHCMIPPVTVLPCVMLSMLPSVMLCVPPFVIRLASL